MFSIVLIKFWQLSCELVNTVLIELDTVFRPSSIFHFSINNNWYCNNIQKNHRATCDYDAKVWNLATLMYLSSNNIKNVVIGN